MQRPSATGMPVPPNAVATLPAPPRVTGAVERLLFHDPAGPYTVALVRSEGEARPLTVVGRFPEVRPGEGIRAVGSWQIHPRYGRQFHADDVTLILPASLEGIRRYLTSPLVAGIGPVTAQRLLDRFGAETLAALDAGISALREVPGIGPTRAERILESWRQHQALREVMLTLFDFGISYRRAEQLYEHYGTQAPLVVRSDPYRLALDVHGIGFHTADRIAAALGVPPEAPSRVQAGLLHCLQAATVAGNTWLTLERLLAECATLLRQRPGTEEATPADVEEERLRAGLQTLTLTGKVVAGEVGGQAAAALAAIATLEAALARGLLRLAEAPLDRLAAWSSLDQAAWERRFAEQGATAARLSDEQRAAVQMALTARVAVLTGGPGTGKTTTLRSLVALALGGGARIALAAPTGRAARRLAEATGLEARTIHRLLRLGYGAGPDTGDDAEAEALALGGLEEAAAPPRPHRGRNARLNADLVVVDEASMLDVPLARALVRAVPPGAHLLLVGDADQLPSVGPGQVLADTIASCRFPIARLGRIFRQGEGSGIAANARRINEGEMPIWEPGLGSNDFYLFNADDAQQGRELVLDLVAHRIPQRFGLSGQAIQVLAPMYRGPLGLTTLNPLLQEALNPPHAAKPELWAGSRLLRAGDRVVQTRNNYDLGVFNGDLGLVAAVDPEGFSARILLDDGREVAYPPRALPELQLAYALSIHRAQGSEFPVVVLPVVAGQFILLSRRLLYTAVTRARQLVVMVGHSRAVSFAVRDAAGEARLTGLVERLQEPPGAEPPAPLRPPRRRKGMLQPALL